MVYIVIASLASCLSVGCLIFAYLKASQVKDDMSGLIKDLKRFEND